jgi:hypothetical protein
MEILIWLNKVDKVVKVDKGAKEVKVDKEMMMIICSIDRI